jgi:hypothetical protein
METEISLSLKPFRILHLEVALLHLKEYHFDARPVLCGKDALLLDVHHRHTNTRLELTGVAPYAVLYFNDDFKFAGATLNLRYHDSPFSILTPYKKVLLLKWPLEFDLKNVLGLNVR